ncbi:unnamed protein product [Prorocentrum cordatum]|uniref:Uncharacterized protein n=1 Tax=Prorocentrum cordatum TaxID=2364126 RepID=A0ABN9VRZ4_9DINO|nr:unnamed protein product [Polarella glacialis]
MALDVPARQGGGAHIDEEAAQPLASRQVVTFEIEPWPPPSQVEAAAPPRRAAPPAVALLAALAALWCWSAAAGRGCAASYSNEKEFVQRYALGPAAVAVPYAALAAWCVWVRGSFQASLPLHRWTRAYGLGAGAAAALFASYPWMNGCEHWRLRGVIFPTLMALKIVSLVIVANKLEELQRPRVALAVQRLSAVMLLGTVLWYELTGVGYSLISVVLSVVLFAVLFAYLGACIFGVCGLLAAAARARSSRSAAQRRAACFVVATALALALSFTTSVMLLFEFGSFWLATLDALGRPPHNCYTDDQLQSFYEKYLDYLDRAQVKRVRCGYLRRLASAGDVMQRCQEVPLDQVFIGSTGFPLVRDGEKKRFVLSHPWLSKEHPDPTGVKLKLLVQQPDMLHASDDHAVFVDYMSLPQNDKLNPELQRIEAASGMPKPGSHPSVRTVAEEAQFKEALFAMEQIYSIGKTPVIVLPMDGDVDAGREYISRGWCLLEFCLSMGFDNISNAAIHEPVRRLREHVESLNGHTVEGFHQAFKLTHFTNKGDANVVLKLFENTLNLPPRGRCWRRGAALAALLWLPVRPGAPFAPAAPRGRRRLLLGLTAPAVQLGGWPGGAAAEEPTPEDFDAIRRAFAALSADPAQPGSAAAVEAAEAAFGREIDRFEGPLRRPGSAQAAVERSQLRLGRAQARLWLNEAAGSARADLARGAVADFDAALAIMDADFRENPGKAMYSEFPSTLTRRGLAKEQLGDWAGAADDYSRAIAAWRPQDGRPDAPLRGSVARPPDGDGLGVNPLVLNFRGNALSRLGRFEQARADYAEAAAIFENDREVRLASTSRSNEALALFGLGDDAEAEQLLETGGRPLCTHTDPGPGVGPARVGVRA